MMRLLTIMAVAMAGGSAAAGRPPTGSWAKAAVSYPQYRDDAIDCAKKGYFRDVSNDEPAKKFVEGFNAATTRLNTPTFGSSQQPLSGLPDMGAWRDSILRTQPDRRKRELQAIQTNDVEQCLQAKGYRKFTLSRAQEKQLARLRRGSEQRHLYLYEIGQSVPSATGD
jgi:hypothetical protein